MPHRPRITVYVVNLSTAAKPRKFLYFQWVDPATGQRHTRSSKCSGIREARREAVRFEDELNTKQPTGDGSMAFSAFVDFYTDEHLAAISVNAEKRVTSVLSMFERIAKPSTLADVSHSMLSEYANKLRTDKKRPRSETTIATHFTNLAAAMSWAVANGHLHIAPKFPRIARAKRQRPKGRPLTDAEFRLMLDAVPGVVGADSTPAWTRLLTGLWLSGLRLGEALALEWGSSEHPDCLWIDLTGKHPLLGIAAESEKGRQDRLLPLTPDFARWLLDSTPEPDRTGFVFPLAKQRHHDIRRIDTTSKTIVAIGAASKVTVNATGKPASAHDLRRSFGLRWSTRLMPAQLQSLMRHESINTTMTFYAVSEANTFAEQLWAMESPENQLNTPHNTKSKKPQK